MGAADFNTSARIEGTKEEILAIIKVLMNYTTEKKDQHNKNRNCPYLSGVYISGDGENGLGVRLNPSEDANYLQLIEERNCIIYVDASGPYGMFGFLDEVDLFHDMAEAAPGASFVGTMEGFNPGGSQLAAFELKENLMHCKYLMPHDDEWDEDDEECENFDEDFDEDCDDYWDEEEPEWDEEAIYDPVNKRNISK